jgi:hypothetical protein
LWIRALPGFGWIEADKAKRMLLERDDTLKES